MRSVSGWNKKKFSTNKFRRFLSSFTSWKLDLKESQKCGSINWCCLSIVPYHQTVPIKDQWSIAIIIRAIKKASREFRQTRKATATLFTIHFFSNWTSRLGNFLFFPSKSILKPTIERSMKFQSWLKLLLNGNVRLDVNVDHASSSTRVFMTWSRPIIIASSLLNNRFLSDFLNWTLAHRKKWIGMAVTMSSSFSDPSNRHQKMTISTSCRGMKFWILN